MEQNKVALGLGNGRLFYFPEVNSKVFLCLDTYYCSTERAALEFSLAWFVILVSKPDPLTSVLLWKSMPSITHE